MNILPNIQIIDLALYIEPVLIIADVHIGYEEALNKQGVLVPRLQFGEMAKRMEKIIQQLNGRRLDTIIVNGDLKHEFGTISEQEWRNTLKFLDLLAGHCNEIILIRGNHDTILGPIARKRNVKVMEYCIIEGKQGERVKNTRILVAHGDKIPEKPVLKNIDAIIIGHEHTAVSIREGSRVETFKCFLKGKYDRMNLIVQPSFNTLVEGTNILRDRILSPFLKQSLDSFEVFVVEDKVYNFGKVKNLR